MIDFKKESIDIDTDKRDIADLCNMCGKCCRSIVTEHTHQELVEMAKKDEREAKIFIDFFKKYDSIEDARKVVPDQVEQVLKLKKEKNREDLDKVSFYYCSYIDDENKCTIHLERPLCCRMAPVDGWSAMPPGCGYEGWQFEERERIKQTVRSFKEELYRAEMTLKPTDLMEGLNGMTVEEFKTQVNEKLEAFNRFGAKNW